ncbi:MAG: asparagine synthase (glutamine-hydrolyzing) [Elusimicrobia bacterium]|nr:asparagine synthase (glutamine-hydrolyzing) [Elusimicrobiota bacterium]
MCGIIGYWNIDSGLVGLEGLLRYISHRGPDDHSITEDKTWGLGHHRLSVIDLETGGQPIVSEDGLIYLVSNNEIYNYRELRSELEERGIVFRTRSDTEVILRAYQTWKEDCFEKFLGMFAVAIIDRSRNVCILARDHLGIKPLHIARYKGGIFFSTNIKPFLALPDFARQLDEDAFRVFMNLRYIPGNDTLFKGIRRIDPGSVTTVSKDGTASTRKYFSLGRHAADKPASSEEAAERLLSHIDESVKRHLVSDVEVGLYLSGGMDSATLASFAAGHNSRIRSFCMNFGEPTDEGEDAAIAAAHIGINHTNLRVGENPLRFLPEVIWHVEEPKVNCIQGYLLAKHVSRHVKVVLSGLGGDELFAGYINNDILYPCALLAGIARMKTSKHLFSMNSVLQSALRNPSLDKKFRIMDLSLSLFDPLRSYSLLRNCFDHSRYLTSSIFGGKYAADDLSYRTLGGFYDPGSRDIIGELLLLEMKTKLINDFLLTEDRVSMAHGLEVRVPLLDRKLVEFALSIPTPMKYSFLRKKKILKKAVTDRLPGRILSKKKWGFSFNPYYQFSKDLKTIAGSVLTRDRVESQGLFSYRWIRQVLDARPDPGMRWHYFNLWVMAGFTLWHDMFIADFSKDQPGPLDL